jgi:hypothetical protein
MNELYYDKNLESEVDYLKGKYSMLSDKYIKETSAFERYDLQNRLLEIEDQLNNLGTYI